jgi:hypothetical protein
MKLDIKDHSETLVGNEGTNFFLDAGASYTLNTEAIGSFEISGLVVR